MVTSSHPTLRLSLLFLVLLSFFSNRLYSQVDWTTGILDLNGIGTVQNGTALQFGPDGRLYVADYRGFVQIYTIVRDGAGAYRVTASETLTVQGIQAHLDNGDEYNGSKSDKRETTGIAVGGTSSNPIIYVSSSDFRIGGGSGGGDGDVDLDTNSGIITRFTWNGSSWDAVDIVRGLPRSEENHGTHGLELATINGKDYLLVCSGGHTNGGSPSANFAYLTEYALSAAVLSVDLSAIESMSIKNDSGRQYIYDLPTLDDPTRANVNGITDPDDPGYDGIDVNDPFGGNDGLNQAKYVPGSPIDIVTAGYRNTYDIAVTESGALYITDNGPNGGWGGLPNNEASASVDNNYVMGEPGASSGTAAPDGEFMNNKDHLVVATTDLDSYTFGSFYGGHPAPIRANPLGAGLYTAPEPSGINNAVFRTQLYDPDGSRSGSSTDPNTALPADWPPYPVSSLDIRQADWRGPGENNPDGDDDELVTIWPNNTNGLDEYTSSAFGGAMQGDLIGGNSDGILFRVQVNPDGSLVNLSELASGLPGITNLGVTCNSDSEIFPGTIWVAPYDNFIIVLEPKEITECYSPGDPEYDSALDYDSDGYTNQDEDDNGTELCNGASQPNDFDGLAGGTLVSDLNDDDDDNDGILDVNDPFQLGDFSTSGSDAFTLPVDNELLNGDPELKGYLGLGLTGLMNNGVGDWLDWIDNGIESPNPNDILGGAIGSMTMQMTSGTALGGSNDQEKAFQYGVQVDSGTDNFTVSSSITNFNDPIQLYGHTGSPDGELGIFIGDGSQSNYIKFVATKDGLEVVQELGDSPQLLLEETIATGDRPSSAIVFYIGIEPSTGNLTFEYSFDGSASRMTIGSVSATGVILDAIQQSSSDLAIGMIGTSNASGVELEGTWEFLKALYDAPPLSEDPIVLYRVNAGGVEVTAIDGEMNWGADETTNPSPYLTNPGSNGSSAVNTNDFSYTNDVDQSTTALDIYKRERFDARNGANMQYSFPVFAEGNYEVRLYLANGFSGTSQPGERIFNVEIEGNAFPELTNLDLSATYGHQVGTVISNVLEITDGSIDIEFIHGPVQNPIISGIEILDVRGVGLGTLITVQSFDNQLNVEGDELDGSLGIVASGGDGNLSYAATGLPPGVFIEPTNGQLGGTLQVGSAANSPYSVTVTVDDDDAESNDVKTVDFVWTVEEDTFTAAWQDKDEDENYTGRHECSFVQAGNKFLLMGGRENSKTVEIYDYASNSWESVPDSAPLAFNHFQAIEYKGLIWVIASFTNNSFPNETPSESIWMFDPVAKEWIEGPSIPVARRRGSTGVVMYNDKFYIVGGNTIGHNGGYVAWFDEYDPATGVWTALADAPRARDHFHAAVIGDKLYAAGGRLSGGDGGTFAPTIPEVDVYDFTTGTWSTLSEDLPTPRGASTSVNYNEKLVVIGGEVQNEVVYGTLTTDALKITEEYDPMTGQWTRLPDLINERHGTQAIVSGEGIFILAGSPKIGGGPNGNQKNMEFYGQDAPSGTSLIASTVNGPSQVLINNGASETIDIDITGGNQAVFIKSMEIVGPDASSFSLTSGGITNGLLNANTSNPIEINNSGIGQSLTAQLVINYGLNNTLTVQINSTESGDGIASINLINATDDILVTSLSEGQSFTSAELAGKQYNFEVLTNPSVVGSVYIELTGPVSNTRTENKAPYAAFGDSSGNFIGRDLPEGNYTITGTAYSEKSRGGSVLGVQSISFSIESGVITSPIALADATPRQGTFPLDVQFTGSNSTDDIGVVSYSWDFGDGGSSTEADPMHTYTAAGTYQSTLTVLDGDGNTDMSSVEIVVTDPNSSTGIASINLINATDDILVTSLSEGQSFTSAELAGKQYNFDVLTNPSVVGSVYIELTGPVSNTRTENKAPYAAFGDSSGNFIGRDLPEGNYTITGTAYSEKSRGGSVLGVQSISFSIESEVITSPIALADATPRQGTFPLDVQFTGSNSTDDIGVVSYSWDFGDGGSSTEADPMHTYTAAGTYQSTLTVLDGDGNTDTSSVEIVVTDSNSGTISLLNPGDQYNVEGDTVNLPINIDGTGSITEYSATGLPPDLTINSSTGVISGTIKSPNTGNIIFEEKDGFIMIEMESASLDGGWELTNIDNTTGVIGGENNFTQQNGGTLTYQIQVNTPGVYRINWRSAFTGDKGSERNDSWLKLPNNENVWFFGQQFAGNEQSIINNLQGNQDNVVFPKGSSRITPQTTPDGAGSNGFFKVFRSGPPAETYKWQAVTFDGNGHKLYAWFVNPGIYLIEVSERSLGHAIDKMVLYRVNASFSDNQLTAASESPRVGGAASGSPYSVVIDVEDDASPPNTDSTSFQWFINSEGNLISIADATPRQGTFPLDVQFTGSNSTDDIGVVSYSWDFGDGGSSTEADPMHTYTAAGTYQSTLTVLDGDGNTDMSSVEIVVTDPNSSTGIASINLINATDDILVTSLSEGQSFTSAELAGKQYNFDVLTNPSVVGSVYIELTGPVSNTRTENKAPYAAFGDSSGNFIGRDLPEGNYTITGTAYSEKSRGGSVLGVQSISFSIESGVLSKEITATSLNQEIKIYPIPVESMLHIHGLYSESQQITKSRSELFSRPLTLRIFDYSGRLIYALKEVDASSLAQDSGINLYLGFLNEGYYILQIDTGDGNIIRKGFIKN